MPRRAVLSDEQRAALLALPDDETLLVQHWTLSRDDLAIIVRRRRPHNRLGFAIQLCALRYPGRFLRPGELIPDTPLAFVAEQLQVGPEVLADYATRGQTRYEQLDALRDAFGFMPLSRPLRTTLQEWLLPIALTTTSGARLARVMLDECRRRRIIVPGISSVERMVAQALLDAERHVAEHLTRGLDARQRRHRVDNPQRIHVDHLSHRHDARPARRPQGGFRAGAGPAAPPLAAQTKGAVLQ